MGKAKIFIVPQEYKAKYKVFFVDQSYKEKNTQLITPGILVKNEYQADVKVFVVDKEYKADIKICYLHLKTIPLFQFKSIPL